METDKYQKKVTRPPKFFPPLTPCHIYVAGANRRYLSTDPDETSKVKTLVVASTKKSKHTKWFIKGQTKGYLLQSKKQGYLALKHSDGSLHFLGAPYEAKDKYTVEWEISFQNGKEFTARGAADSNKTFLNISDGNASLRLSGIAMMLSYEMGDDKEPEYACPYCGTTSLTEDQLWDHWPKAHGHERSLQCCPICTHQNQAPQKVGSSDWGFGNHLFHHHGPSSRRPQPGSEGSKRPTHSFSVVVVQHPITKKFLLVEEGAGQGWWLPAGRVDPGEDFMQAAIRETEEEGGIDIKLTGILRIEYSAFKGGGARQRIVFFAEPVDKDQKPKSEPDYESLRAVWITSEKLLADVKSGKKHLRGPEPSEWFPYVAGGGPIHPISILAHEKDRVKLPPRKKSSNTLLVPDSNAPPRSPKIHDATEPDAEDKDSKTPMPEKSQKKDKKKKAHFEDDAEGSSSSSKASELHEK